MTPGSIVTHIGRCELTDGPPGEVRGYWQEATCEEYCAALQAKGGTANLKVWSGFTNLEWDPRLGEPFVFTCWGEKTPNGNPVAADGGSPYDRKVSADGGPCRLTHAVFVPAVIVENQ